MENGGVKVTDCAAVGVLKVDNIFISRGNWYLKLNEPLHKENWKDLNWADEMLSCSQLLGFPPSTPFSNHTLC